MEADVSQFGHGGNARNAESPSLIEELLSLNLRITRGRHIHAPVGEDALDHTNAALESASSRCFHHLSVSRLLNSSYFSANASSGSAHIFSLTSASSRINPVTWSMPSFYKVVLKASKAALRFAR